MITTHNQRRLIFLWTLVIHNVALRLRMVAQSTTVLRMSHMSNAKGGRILQGSLVFFIEVNTFKAITLHCGENDGVWQLTQPLLKTRQVQENSW